MSQVGAPFVHEPEAEALPRLFLEFLHRSELQAGDSPCVGRSQASPGDQVLGAALDVELQLVGHVVFHLGAMDDVVPERADAGPEGHHASCARSAMSTASDARLHRSVSAFRRFRPAAVRL